MTIYIYGADTIVLPATFEGSTTRSVRSGMARMRKRRRIASEIIQASSTGTNFEQTAAAAAALAIIALALRNRSDHHPDQTRGRSTALHNSPEGEESGKPVREPDRGTRDNADGGEPTSASAGERTRGLPPSGLLPPVANPEKLREGEPSRPSEQERDFKSLWDEDGGEWRYSPEGKWHHPHWDYNPHTSRASQWGNVPIEGRPPRKDKP